MSISVCFISNSNFGIYAQLDINSNSYKSAIFMICLNSFQKNEHFEGIQSKTEFTKIDNNS